MSKKAIQNSLKTEFHAHSKVLSPKLAMGLGGQIVYFHQAEFQHSMLILNLLGLSFTLNEDHIFYCSLSNQIFLVIAEIPDQLNTQWRYSITGFLAVLFRLKQGFIVIYF